LEVGTDFATILQDVSSYIAVGLAVVLNANRFSKGRVPASASPPRPWIEGAPFVADAKTSDDVLLLIDEAPPLRLDDGPVLVRLDDRIFWLARTPLV
jgi:hypothetical protein